MIVTNKSPTQRGAKFNSPPKPRLTDALYLESWREDSPTFMPLLDDNIDIVFDAPDFVRFGRDVIVQANSHVTNALGIEWMRRHCDERGLRLHELQFADRRAFHVDSTFVPVDEGRLLVNPTRPCLTGDVVRRYRHAGRDYEYRLPKAFKDWELLIPPAPTLANDHPLYISSAWSGVCNTLVLRPGLVLAMKHEPRVAEQFAQWGIEPIVVEFKHFLSFGGGFHCATLDVRRRGERRQHLNVL